MGTPSKSKNVVPRNHLVWTNAAIAALPVPVSTYKLSDPLTLGLTLFVDHTGGKSLRFTHQLGSSGLVSLNVTFLDFDIDAARVYVKKYMTDYVTRLKKRAACEWSVSTLNGLPAHDKSLPSRYYEIQDPAVRGLRLRINTAGQKFFYFRYTCFGKKWADELGEFGQILIAEARSTAKGIRAFIKEECS